MTFCKNCVEEIQSSTVIAIRFERQIRGKPGLEDCSRVYRFCRPGCAVDYINLYSQGLVTPLTHGDKGVSMLD
jgi:hypothetical protein